MGRQEADCGRLIEVADNVGFYYSLADNFFGTLAAERQIEVGRLIEDRLLEVWLYKNSIPLDFSKETHPFKPHN